MIIGIFLVFLFSGSARAADLGLTDEQLQFINDISIAVTDVDQPEDIIVGKTIRLYATVHNRSDKDQKGIVRFYNERLKQFIGADQPFSAVAGGEDTVFIDVELNQAGKNVVAIRVVPDQPKGNDPANDKITTTLVADVDTDQDGVSNRNDPDADSDGVPNAQDAFPLDVQESQDTDHDGVGNNADTDDDNDQVPDVEDPLPQNHAPVPVITVQTGSSSQPSRSGEASQTPSQPSSPASSGSQSSAQPSVVPLLENPPSLSGQTGQLITFNGQESYDPDGHLQTIEWDFGDGETAKGVVASHVFRRSGTYNVIATVTDDQGETTQQKMIVQVQSTAASRISWLLLLALLLLLGIGLRKGLPRLKKSSKIRKLF